MEIVNYCRHAPVGAIWHLKQALQWFDPSHLDGLDCVQLFDEMPEVTEDTPESIKRHLEAGDLCPGQYIPSKGGQPAYITLFLNVIYRPIPSIFYLSPIARIRLTADLAPGVAYHVLRKTTPRSTEGEEYLENEEDERFVNEYVAGVLKGLQSRLYYRFGQWQMKYLADRYYLLGAQEWKAKHYNKAAEQWGKACFLNPDHKDAAEWYWRAREMQGTQHQE